MFTYYDRGSIKLSKRRIKFDPRLPVFLHAIALYTMRGGVTSSLVASTTTLRLQ